MKTENSRIEELSDDHSLIINQTSKKDTKKRSSILTNSKRNKDIDPEFYDWSPSPSEKVKRSARRKNSALQLMDGLFN